MPGLRGRGKKAGGPTCILTTSWNVCSAPCLTDLQQAVVMSSGFTFQSVQGGSFLADTVGRKCDDKQPRNERPC